MSCLKLAVENKNEKQKRNEMDRYGSLFVVVMIDFSLLLHKIDLKVASYPYILILVE